MAKSLYEFMSQLNQDNVRTQNLFEMKVFIPHEIIAKGNDQAGDQLTEFFDGRMTFYGTGFQLPSRTINTANVGFKGFTVPIPTTMQMEQQHTVTINADINGDLRRAFLTWQSCTMNPQINSQGGFFEGNRHLSNTSKIYILLLDPTFKDSHGMQDIYEIDGVFVSQVGNMQLSNTESAVATFDVTFTSQYWQVWNENGESNDDRTRILSDWKHNLNHMTGDTTTQRKFTNIF